MAKEWAKWFYNSKEWKETRKYILKRDRYTCRQPGCYRIAEEVHHIEELTPENINDINISLNPKNLIALCSDCHKAITKREHRSNKTCSILPVVMFDEKGYPVIDSPGRGNEK